MPSSGPSSVTKSAARLGIGSAAKGGMIVDRSGPIGGSSGVFSSNRDPRPSRRLQEVKRAIRRTSPDIGRTRARPRPPQALHGCRSPSSGGSQAGRLETLHFGSQLQARRASVSRASRSGCSLFKRATINPRPANMGAERLPLDARMLMSIRDLRCEVRSGVLGGGAIVEDFDRKHHSAVREVGGVVGVEGAPGVVAYEESSRTHVSAWWHGFGPRTSRQDGL